MQRALASMALLLSMTSVWAAGPAPADPQWLSRSVTVDGKDYPVLLFVPRAPATPAPAILFLHGSGERGDDGKRQADVGLGPYLRRHAADFPAYVVLPQAPADSSWTGATAQAALAALDLLESEYSIDTSREYLTGMSRGGYGTWELALVAGERFAALVPVCAGVLPPADRDDLEVRAVTAQADPYGALAQAVGQTPVWMFHGAHDDLVLPADSRKMFDVLKAQGSPVRYTEFPDANHNAWDPAYGMPELWEWLFKQRRGTAREGLNKSSSQRRLGSSFLPSH